tara:strand:- start:488 stop:1756 length:1269 start_codon:yes stop_codon:yes gene_type:complete
MKLKALFNYFFIILISVSFLLGFYLNEDSAGGGKIDLYEHEWDNLVLFKNTPLLEALTSLKYESSRTPLFLIIHKYNFFINEIDDLRFSTFIFGWIIFGLLYCCLKIIFKNGNNSLILLISSFILLSPYFRSSVFWANQEHLSILFFIISLIFFKLCWNKEEKINNYFLYASLSSLFAFLSFYSDQKFFFMSIIVYLYFVRNNSLKFFIFFSFLNLAFFLPTIYLFSKWGGIVPVESQYRMENTWSNLNIVISNIGIYFIPLFLVFISQEKFKKITLNKYELVFFIISGIILFLFLPNDPSKEGSGILFRLISIIYLKEYFLIDWQIFKFIYFMINLFFLYLLLIFLKKSINNFIIISSFCLIFCLTWFTYQSYVDPVFFIMIYALLDIKRVNINSERLAYINGSYYALILISSIIFRSFII